MRYRRFSFKISVIPTPKITRTPTITITNGSFDEFDSEGAEGGVGAIGAATRLRGCAGLLTRRS